MLYLSFFFYIVATQTFIILILCVKQKPNQLPQHPVLEYEKKV